ncbi:MULTISPECIES: hypothetical protein [Rhodococcus]|uniref:hypothetical protein n=1 Tax=Rhodococcus TaxID=1827 RepID=UPI000C7C7CEB|nr:MULTISPECIES: hypothetical protein [Rhodococcus]AUM18270.1 hypothetical protein CSW53_18110 [Rhodococcus ruber]
MSINASPATVLAVGAALGRAALFDDRITADDKLRIAAWAEALDSYRFDEAHLLGAVTAYYREPRDRSISVGDLVKLAREARRDSAEREDRLALEARQVRNDVRHGITAPDPGLIGLPIRAEGPPVPGAYQVNDAVDRDCPQCGAEVMYPCTMKNSKGEVVTRKMPCVPRMIPRLAKKRHAA